MTRSSVDPTSGGILLKRGIVFCVVILALLGCGSRSDVLEKMDPSSAERLAGLTEDMRVVLACKMPTLPETLKLPDGGRELARSGNAVLFEVPRLDLEGLEGFGDAEMISVWGEMKEVQKMDHELQKKNLEAWSEDPGRKLSMRARFKPGTQNLRAVLDGAGVKPRTVAGIVVTVTADCSGVLRMIQLPDLVTLSNPRELQPNE
jgi:hypothetical protein